MTNLARIRKSSGISQKELANLCGISIKTIQAYEQRLKDINRAEVKTLFKISQILMVDINDLLESKDLVIEKAYAKRIEFLYSAEGKQIFNAENLDSLK